MFMHETFRRDHLKQSVQIYFQIFPKAPTKVGPSGDTFFDWHIRKILYFCQKQQFKMKAKFFL